MLWVERVESTSQIHKKEAWPGVLGWWGIRRINSQSETLAQGRSGSADRGAQHMRSSAGRGTDLRVMILFHLLHPFSSSLHGFAGTVSSIFVLHFEESMTEIPMKEGALP